MIIISIVLLLIFIIGSLLTIPLFFRKERNMAKSKKMYKGKDKRVFTSSFAKTKKVSRGSGVQLTGTRF